MYTRYLSFSIKIMIFVKNILNIKINKNGKYVIDGAVIHKKFLQLNVMLLRVRCLTFDQKLTRVFELRALYLVYKVDYLVCW